MRNKKVKASFDALDKFIAKTLYEEDDPDVSPTKTSYVDPFSPININSK